jgi:hypothetical protein
MFMRRALAVDTEPLGARLPKGVSGPRCRAGCGALARYHGYCFAHWKREQSERKVTVAAFRREVAAAKSNAEALRRLGWSGPEGLARLEATCHRLHLQTPAQRVATRRREMAGRRPGSAGR